MQQLKESCTISWLLIAISLIALIAHNGFANAQEEDEELKKTIELRESYKKLYRRETPLDPDEAFKMLQTISTVDTVVDRFGLYGVPIDTMKLLAYANVTKEKCNEPDKVAQMRKDFDLAKNEYPGLLPYVSEHFRAQFELCGFHIKYREDFANFKEKRKGLWGKMNAFKNRVAKFGKISKDWKQEKLDNPHQFNEAFYDLYNDKKGETKSGGGHRFDRRDAAINSYNEAHELIQGSHYFGKEVKPSIELATNHPEWKSDDELRDALRHNNVYGQVLRTNFEPSMGKMFADAYYDKDDKMWESWTNFQHLYL